MSETLSLHFSTMLKLKHTLRKHVYKSAHVATRGAIARIGIKVSNTDMVEQQFNAIANSIEIQSNNNISGLMDLKVIECNFIAP